MYKCGDSRVYKLLCEISLMSPSLHMFPVEDGFLYASLLRKLKWEGWKGREEKEMLIIAYTPHDSESNYQGTFSEILIKQKEIELHTLLLTYKLYSSIKVSLHA